MFKPAAIFSDHMVLCHDREVRIFGYADTGKTISAGIDNCRGECIAQGSGIAREERFLLRLPPLPVQTGCCLRISDGRKTIRIEDVAIGEVFLAGGQSNMELELQNADEGLELLALHNDPDLRFFNVPKQPVWNEQAQQAEEQSHWAVVHPGECRDVSAVAYFCSLRLRKEKNIPVGVIDCYWGGTSASCWMDEEALLRTKAGQYYLSAYEAMYGHKTEMQFDMEAEQYQRSLDEYAQRVNAIKAEKPDVSPSELNELAGAYPWPPPAGCKSPYRPAGLVETMLKRVVPYTLTAFLFYQGEEDSSRPSFYEELLTSMIIRWRELFMDEDLPFIIVQLPMFISKGIQDDRTWAVIRQAQHRVWRTLRNTGLAILIDCGEFDNIHPTDKRTPGERLYNEVLRVVYGDNDAPASPRAIQKYTEKNSIVVSLSQKVIEKNGEADLFEIAGDDGRFYPANVQLYGDRLILTAEEVDYPTKTRYAWVNYGVVHLFGENGLPLAPFLLE